MSKTMKQKIIDEMRPHAKGLRIADIRIGVIYTSVRLSNGNTGVAWTGQSKGPACRHLDEAGTFTDRPAVELLEMIADAQNPVYRTIGLATANALSSAASQKSRVKNDILDIIDIQENEHVVMVGFFAPLIPRIRKTGCRLDILELNSEKPGTISPEEGKPFLAECDIAIITATSLITDTIDNLLTSLSRPRAAVILGPSSFMYPPVYKETPITHIAGSRVRNPSAVEKIVSQGGGTRTLKKHMAFETLCL